MKEFKVIVLEYEGIFVVCYDLLIVECSDNNFYRFEGCYVV